MASDDLRVPGEPGGSIPATRAKLEAELSKATEQKAKAGAAIRGAEAGWLEGCKASASASADRMNTEWMMTCHMTPSEL